jgi:hypothetical protein
VANEVEQEREVKANAKAEDEAVKVAEPRLILACSNKSA